RPVREELCDRRSRRIRRGQLPERRTDGTERLRGCSRREGDPKGRGRYLLRSSKNPDLANAIPEYKPLVVNSTVPIFVRFVIQQANDHISAAAIVSPGRRRLQMVLDGVSR